MEEQQRTPTPEQGQPEHGFSSNEGHMQGTKQDQLSQTHRSPIRLFITIIVAIFMAEVVAMMVVQVIEPVPYYQVTLIDAGIMTILIFPVLYFLSFRPLLREIEIGRQTEQSLLRSRDLQEEFFDSIDTLIAYMDCDFKFIRVNDAYARASGYPTEYFRGKNHFALYPHAENQEIFRWVVQTGDGYVAHEKSFEYPDKPERGITYWNWSLQPVKGWDERVEGLVLSLVDVTERKRAEERLRKVHDELELRVQERTDELRIANSELEDEINVRKRTEEALRKSELGLKHAQEIAHLGSWELDLLRNQLSWSDEVYRIFGLQPQEFKATYEAFLEIVHPEDRAAVDQVYSSSLRDGKAGYEIEHRIIRRSSSEVRTVHEKCEHLRNEAGQIVRSGGMVHDITERKQAEEELRAARDELEIHVRERTKELADANRELLNEIYERKEIERQLRVQATAMEAAASGIVITDREGKVQWTNPALAQMSGYDARELIGQNMQIFKSGQHGTEYYRELWDTILSGQVWRGETTNRHKDGRLYVEEQTITPVRDDQGQITQFIAIKQDITERKQAEEALRKSEEKFRTLVDWTYDWEFWIDPQGDMVYTSPSCERITGYRPGDFISDSELMINIVHLEDRQIVMDHQRSIHNNGAGVEKMEFRILTPEGQERWIEHICRPLLGTADQYLGRRVSNRDITQRKQAEEMLRERNQKEKLLTETIHTMQLDIARDLHDTLGQNISFLRMKLDYLSGKKIRKQAEMQAEIRNMAQAANESYDLMRGTLAVLQSESSTDLFRLFIRYAEQIEERAGFKTKFLNQGEPRFMSARRMRQLFYIFREILSNIEKHSKATEVCIEMTWGQDHLQLSVLDNGSGFDRDNIQFVGHYGLRFMKERADLLNGSLNIHSAVGSGTNITLEVPYE